jgi:hypothetical protein
MHRTVAMRGFSQALFCLTLVGLIGVAMAPGAGAQTTAGQAVPAPRVVSPAGGGTLTSLPASSRLSLRVSHQVSGQHQSWLSSHRWLAGHQVSWLRSQRLLHGSLRPY